MGTGRASGRQPILVREGQSGGGVVIRAGEERKSKRAWWVGALIVGLLLVWAVWWQWDNIVSRLSGPRGPGATEVAGSVGEIEGDRPDAEEQPSEISLAERYWTETLGQPPAWPEDLRAPESCDQVEAELARICGVVDQRDYVAAAGVAGGTCGLIRTLADELAARPPRISSELKSYETMLDNVFHLFRVVGRKRLELVRRIQWEEHELAEPASMALYRWLVSRTRCARSGATAVTPETLYAYAGFLFNTMGGQAYLRRRSPRAEALASFYALLIIDEAQSADYDPAGVDPRQEILRTRELLGAQPLVFREHYLLILDRMAERWKERSAPA